MILDRLFNQFLAAKAKRRVNNRGRGAGQICYGETSLQNEFSWPLDLRLLRIPWMSTFFHTAEKLGLCQVPKTQG